MGRAKIYDPETLADEKLNYRAKAKQRKKYGQTTAEKHEKYFQIMKTARENNVPDLRKEGKICCLCKKQYIKFEEFFDKLYDIENETLARGSIVKKKIWWAGYCIKCGTNVSRNKIKQGEKFIRWIAQGVAARHLGGTIDDCVCKVKELLQQTQNKCAACNVCIVLETKSGWKQMSVTDMNPHTRGKNKTCNLSDLRVVCLACQKFQNKMSWSNFMYALRIELSGGPDDKTQPTQFIYNSWLRPKIYTSNTADCPPQIQRQVITRDGFYCRYTGLEVFAGRNHWRTLSFDRLNNFQGYSLENTQVVCFNINLVKQQNIKEKDLIEWINHVRNEFQHIMLFEGVFSPMEQRIIE